MPEPRNGESRASYLRGVFASEQGTFINETVLEVLDEHDAQADELDRLRAENERLRGIEVAARDLHAAYEWPQRPPHERNAGWQQMEDALGIERDEP